MLQHGARNGKKFIFDLTWYDVIMNLQPDYAYKVYTKHKLFLCADLNLTSNISVVTCMYVHAPSIQTSFYQIHW